MIMIQKLGMLTMVTLPLVRSRCFRCEEWFSDTSQHAVFCPQTRFEGLGFKFRVL